MGTTYLDTHKKKYDENIKALKLDFERKKKGYIDAFYVNLKKYGVDNIYPNSDNSVLDEIEKLNEQELHKKYGCNPFEKNQFNSMFVRIGLGRDQKLEAAILAMQ